MNVHELQPIYAFIFVEISDGSTSKSLSSFTDSVSDCIMDFEYTRVSNNPQGDKFTLSLYDDTAIEIEDFISNSLSNTITVRYGNAKDGGVYGETAYVTAVLESYELSFEGLGSTLTLEGSISGSEDLIGDMYSTSYDADTYEGRPSEIVRSICEYEGWPIGKIEKTKVVYDSDGESPKTYRREQQTSHSFIQSLLPECVSEKTGSGSYRFFLGENGKVYLVSVKTKVKTKEASRKKQKEFFQGASEGGTGSNNDGILTTKPDNMTDKEWKTYLKKNTKASKGKKTKGKSGSKGQTTTSNEQTSYKHEGKDNSGNIITGNRVMVKKYEYSMRLAESDKPESCEVPEWMLGAKVGKYILVQGTGTSLDGISLKIKRLIPSSDPVWNFGGMSKKWDATKGNIVFVNKHSSSDWWNKIGYAIVGNVKDPASKSEGKSTKGKEHVTKVTNEGDIIMDGYENKSTGVEIVKSYEYYSGRKDNAVISFTPQYTNKIANVATSGGVKATSIDSTKNEMIEIMVGGDKSYKGISDRVSTAVGLSSSTKKGLEAMASSMWEKLSSYTQNKAELEMLGDATVKINTYIYVAVYTKYGFLHHSSGVYYVESAQDSISGGSYTTTLSLVKVGSTKDKATLYDPNNSTGGGIQSNNQTGSNKSGNGVKDTANPSSIVAIEKAVQWAIKIAKDDSHGYDQSHRTGPDYDCSSLVSSAYKAAGVDFGIQSSGTIAGACLKHGFKNVSSNVNFAKGTGLQRGDILVHTGHHVSMYIGDGKIVSAHINEHGKVSGGKTGDQNGKEISITKYFNHPYNVCLRYSPSLPGIGKPGFNIPGSGKGK